MKTYTYSYQNVRKPGRLRTAPAGAGKLAEYPNARTTVGAGVCGRRRIWPGTRRDPNARTTVGAYRIRPPNGPQGPNGTYPAGL